MGKNGVPDRWEAYSKIGKVVEGTRFVAFKVPLKQYLLDKVSEGVDNKWRVEDLIEAVPLGLVIDLTFTTRYYDPQIFTSKEIGHKKILTKGHEIPDKNVVNEFYSAVDSALSKEDDKLIGVHCTHGLNRTGYLVCRYMIEKLGLDPEAAIAAFDEARGHKQERQNYINNLKNKGWENAVEEENKQDTYGAWRAARGGGGKMGSDRNRDKNMERGGGFTSFVGGPSGYRSFRGGFNEREYGNQGCYNDTGRRGRNNEWGAFHGRTGYEERYGDMSGANYGRRGDYEGSYGDTRSRGGANRERRGHYEGGYGDARNGGHQESYGDWRSMGAYGDKGGYYGSERRGDYQSYQDNGGKWRNNYDQGRTNDSYGRRGGYSGNQTGEKTERRSQDRRRSDERHSRGRERSDYQS